MDRRGAVLKSSSGSAAGVAYQTKLLKRRNPSPSPPSALLGRDLHDFQTSVDSDGDDRGLAATKENHNLDELNTFDDIDQPDEDNTEEQVRHRRLRIRPVRGSQVLAGRVGIKLRAF